MMTDLPKDFVERMRAQRVDADQLFEALNDTPPTSIRLNPRKNASIFHDAEQVPWCASGRYLTERPSFTKDPLFHAGVYYPQEAGSMFIHAILQQLEISESAVALDLCAAPGGKSTILLDNLSENALVISNEIVRNRAFILRDTLTKWGASNVLLTNKSATDFKRFQGLFDLVLVDAPCSGEGMFRKDKNARSEWSPGNAATCALRQTDILADIWPALKTDGYLIYSTCTFNPEENDKQIQGLLENQDCERLELHFPDEYNLEKTKYGFACLPHLMRSEGFYFSVLRKKERVQDYAIRKSKKQVGKENVFPLPLHENMQATEIQGHFYQAPKNQIELMLHLNEQLGSMKFGTRLGEFIQQKFNPHFEYAMAVHASKTFPQVELNLDQALLYLKGNSIEVAGKDGWHMAAYQNSTLGWFKKIGNRINNYYPKELRIRMEVL
jgi:16S rRNA C967 or C1407 C5-methylase (RsmB/RsmF family)/NOL1/NOP2/fmu family ribosome biogenesis protein